MTVRGPRGNTGRRYDCPMSAIGIARVISAAGFVTTLGGGAMSARTRAAIDEAAQANWRIDDLQAWAGGLIAEATGAEAGWVTSGAAAGLTLAAAACIAGTRLDAIDRLPEPGAVPAEIIVQRGHRNAYDRQLRNVGARLVEVGYPANEGVGATLEWQLEAAFGERTVAVAHLACADTSACRSSASAGSPTPTASRCSSTPRPSCRRARTCAASRPPAPTPSCFSGGKAIARPAGLRRACHHARARAPVRLQALDMDVDADAWRAREGRSRRTTVSAAGSRSGRRRSPASPRRCRSSASATSTPRRPTPPSWLATLPGEVVTDRGFWPQLVVAAGDRAEAIAAELAAADPAVIVPHARVRAGEIVICPEAIRLDDRDHVASALRAAIA